MTIHVAIRADGGPDIGYGHLVRTGALARECLRRGHGVTYLSTTPKPARSVVPARAEVFDLDSSRRRDTNTPSEANEADGASENGIERFVRWVKERQPAVLVIDSYDFDLASQRELRTRVPVLCLVSDDVATVCTDVLVNGNLYAPGLEYGWVGPEPTWCLGPEYLLLREAFAATPPDATAWREPPERALVTMGGSDVENTTPAVLRAFDALGSVDSIDAADGTGAADAVDTELTVDVIVGPGFENTSTIRRVARSVEREVRIHREPEDVAGLMRRADLAVSALGSTAYELLATATPTVGLVHADNQRPIARALKKRDAAVVLDVPSEEVEPAVTAALRSLLRDADRRRALCERGMELIDGEGAKRVCNELISAVGRN